MNYAQHFFIGPSYMGTTTRGYFTFHQKFASEGRPYDIHSTAWFCETCGEVWARALVENLTTQESHPYRIAIHGCRLHPTRLHRTPPGSIRSWYTELLPYLPDAMVEYEFTMLMKYLDESEENE